MGRIMIGVLRTCPLFTKIVDTFAPISNTNAQALKGIGVGAVGRYLENLTSTERDGIFAAGLGILPLSTAPTSPLTKELGISRADALFIKATQIGVPTGVHVMVDFEAQQGAHADIVAYDEALTAELSKHQYIPLAYVGAGQALSGAELYTLPDTHLYWRGGSLGMPEPSCGFAMWQIPPLEQKLTGVDVDMSITGADLKGRRPVLWWGS